MEEQSVKLCCATFYGSDAARMLLGDSFHPGGIKLTERLEELLGLKSQSHVLDVATGRGTSALHLAERFGCKVTGVDLSDENVHLAEAEATRRGLAWQISFQLEDAERLPFGDEAFDAIVCECAFCTFPSKKIAAREFYRVLKTGLLGLSDLTRNEVAISGLKDFYRELPVLGMRCLRAGIGKFCWRLGFRYGSRKTTAMYWLRWRGRFRPDCLEQRL